MNSIELIGAGVFAALLLVAVAVACLGDEGRRNSARQVLGMLLSREARKDREVSSAPEPPTATKSVTTITTKTKSTTVTKTKTNT